MLEIQGILKQVEELHSSIIQIEESLTNLEIKVESRILDIILNNYREALMKTIQN